MTELPLDESMAAFRAWLVSVNIPIPENEVLTNGFLDTMLQNMWYAWQARNLLDA